MLLVWKMPVARPTRDIDLLGRVSNDLASVRVIASILIRNSDDRASLFGQCLAIHVSQCRKPAAIVHPTILGYSAPELHAYYNRETVIAENFEAMVKLGELNSRMKDFFDIWVRSRTGQFRSAEAHFRSFGRTVGLQAIYLGGGTLAWPNGADIAPARLYEMTENASRAVERTR